MVEALLENCAQEVAVPENGYKVQNRSNFSAADAYVSAEEPAELTPIQRFYDGQSVLITGGTGFVGKLLIEKLLRGCPGVSFIYILVRPKKGKDAHQRIEELFDDPLFTTLKDEKPKFRHQIVAIAGDCAEPGLGISPEDRATLIKEVSIIFHVAATVRFDEKIKLAAAINVRSVKDIINLCKEMQDLKALIHVSTAYANCPYKEIEEKFYDPPIEADKLLAVLDCLDEKLLEEMTPKLLGKWPNTYAYTKAVAENVVQKEAGNMPIGVFRPAIVVSTYQEPVRGWIDNMYGPTGVAAGAGTGLLRSIHCDGSIRANVVPGDMTVNALIASAWDTANSRRLKQTENGPVCENEVPIYNYVSQENPITYDDLKIMSAKYGMTTPTCRAIWYYSFRNNKYRFIHLFFVYFFHLLPALLIDMATLCVGKQPRLLKIYKKIHKFMDVLNYFTTQQWNFKSNNVQSMQARLSPEDQRNFFSEIRELNWDRFFQTYVKGIRIYLIKDPIETLPQAQAKWQKLYWMHQATKLVLSYCALRISWAVLSSLLRAFDYL